MCRFTVYLGPPLRLSTLLNPANLPAFVSGVLAGTFWALAPVFTTRLGLDGADTARFMAAAVGGGMLVVYPLGWLSDRIGRSAVLSLLGFVGLYYFMRTAIKHEPVRD